jgi:phosphoglycolate phosphatase-like HAD superfamily hydrolase
MQNKLIVFDIDGTLLQSIATHHLAMTEAMDASDLIHKDPQWANYAHHTDSGVYYEAYEKSFGKPPSAAECLDFEALFNACYERLRVADTDVEIPGAGALLRRLEASGEWLVAFATGSYRGPAEHKLQRLGVASRSCVLATASEFRTRQEIVADAIRRRLAGFKPLPRGRTISVGDGPWDARTAADLGLPFIGIGEGEQASRLVELGARAVLPDFVDVARFMSAIEFS